MTVTPVHATLSTEGALRTWEAGFDHRLDHICPGEPTATCASEVTCSTCLPYVSERSGVSRIPMQRRPSPAS